MLDLGSLSTGPVIYSLNYYQSKEYTNFGSYISTNVVTNEICSDSDPLKLLGSMGSALFSGHIFGFQTQTVSVPENLHVQKFYCTGF